MTESLINLLLFLIDYYSGLGEASRDVTQLT